MQLADGYKQTEVGVIPEDWDVTTLGNLGDFKNGINKSKEGFGFGFPFVNLMDVFGIPKITDGKGLKLINSTAAERQQFDVRKGDVLFVRSSVKPTGVGLTSAILCDLAETVFSGFLIRFRDDGQLDLNFKTYCFHEHFFRQRLIANSSASANTNINQDSLKALTFPIPPLAEQRAIAEALSDVDALIDALDALITKKRLIKQGTMQQLLTGKKRLPGFSGEWEDRPLGDLAKIQRGASPRPINSPIWFDESSPIGWVRISDVTSAGMYLLETTQRLSELGVQHSRPVGRGNLIMSICATVGRPIFTGIDVCIHDGFVVFDNLKADKKFIFYVLQSIERDWSQHGQTGSQMNLNTTLIRRTEILMPANEDEQTAIAKVLSDMDAEITALEQKRDKTKLIKQGMMQELLTGKTRLT